MIMGSFSKKALSGMLKPHFDKLLEKVTFNTLFRDYKSENCLSPKLAPISIVQIGKKRFLNFSTMAPSYVGND